MTAVPFILSFAAFALALLNLFRTRGSPAERRSNVRSNYARLSVDYAEQLGGTPEQKRAHAVSNFQILDMADNKRRDYSDAEIRLAIESELGARK